MPFVWAWYQTQTLISPAAAWYFFYLFEKNVAQSATFFSKRCPVPPCRRRIGPFVQADVSTASLVVAGLPGTIQPDGLHPHFLCATDITIDMVANEDRLLRRNIEDGQRHLEQPGVRFTKAIVPRNHPYIKEGDQHRAEKKVLRAVNAICSAVLCRRCCP